MRVVFTPRGWKDYTFWQTDLRKLRQISKLIDAIQRDPHHGIGQPELLKHQSFQGCWSRRIDQEHRLVYQIEAKDLIVISCRLHYER